MSTTKGIDFTNLSLRDALDLAVLIEIEARDRYEEFADQMDAHHTPEASRFFRFMAINEEKHRASLAERRGELFGEEPTVVSPSMIFDIEAPDYDEARAFMTARDALDSAMRSETKAHGFFDRALPSIADKDVRELFEELRAEEVEHQELVQQQLDKLPPDNPLAAADFADDPVSH
jgi:rubrerythrin